MKKVGGFGGFRVSGFDDEFCDDEDEFDVRKMNLDGDDNDYVVMMTIFVGFGKNKENLLQHF